MPYPTQGRTIFDDVKRLNMSRLIEGGYIDPGKQAKGNLVWSENFKMRAKVGVHSLKSIAAGTGLVELIYTCNGEPINYFIDVVSKKSNLANGGLIWYFVCPQTDKLARKLYFNGRVFIHQSAIDGIYRTQTLSHKSWDMDKLFGYLLGPNDVYKQLSEKHLKKFYKGSITKKYKKLLIWKSRVDRITHEDVERLLITGSF
ncbi:hypothetical protein QWY86_02930 [Pedobacter aquatilis]|uniref:hypothetical protein n=1 Tax=Pedobacter aquatilis TaxID=351343 RepID=UPI0025B585EE|nr:hypothetical protein [Pedobacter aquatilis]MDN3585605.1 hypothetical protein [Pedobacter aquatilis]